VTPATDGYFQPSIILKTAHNSPRAALFNAGLLGNACHAWPALARIIAPVRQCQHYQ
jgi:hypothetical protein